MDAKRRILLTIMATITLFIVGLTGGYTAAQGADQVIRITAKKFVHTPKEITLKKGVPVTLEFISEDILHGFNCPDLGIRSDILPGKTTTLRFIPDKVGTFPFHCDNFCGSGHETMTGTIIVKE